MIDPNIQLELRNKYNPDNSTLRRGQLRMLEMLKFIDHVCSKYKLTYWLDGGTLLGAARHQGFIPWDDDTDIVMPYDDMMRLSNIMAENYADIDFVIQCHKTDPRYYGSWYVLRDLKSEYIQDSYLHRIRKYRGLQVDIFPFEHTHKILYKFGGRLHLYLVEFPLSGRLKCIRSMVPVNFSILQKLIYPIFRLFPLKKTDILSYGYGNSFRIWQKKDDIYPLKRIKFEGLEFNVPNNYKKYLKNIYGEWEKLPSESEIVTHNVQIKFKD